MACKIVSAMEVLVQPFHNVFQVYQLILADQYRGFLSCAVLHSVRERFLLRIFCS